LVSLLRDGGIVEIEGKVSELLGHTHVVQVVLGEHKGSTIAEIYDI
jgi:hypothetical protein